MKTLLPYLICIVLGLLLARECNRDKTPETIVRTITVQVPEIINQFDTIKVNKPVLVHVPDLKYKELYLNTKDTVERLRMYLYAITVRDYNNQFKDDVQEINVFSRVRGELISQAVDYKVYQREIKHTETFEIPQRRHLYLVPSIGYNWQNYQLKAGASLLYIDKKTRLYSVGYDTGGFINVGYGLKF